jgi:hypothetical protein
LQRERSTVDNNKKRLKKADLGRLERGKKVENLIIASEEREMSATA